MGGKWRAKIIDQTHLEEANGGILTTRVEATLIRTDGDCPNTTLMCFHYIRRLLLAPGRRRSVLLGDIPQTHETSLITGVRKKEDTSGSVDELN